MLCSRCCILKFDTDMHLTLLQLLRNTKCMNWYQQVKAAARLTLVKLYQVSGKLPSKELSLKLSSCNCTNNNFQNTIGLLVKEEHNRQPALNKQTLVQSFSRCFGIYSLTGVELVHAMSRPIAYADQPTVECW